MQSPIPAITHSLQSLSKILDKAEAHCIDNKIDPNALLTARLFPDMAPLTRNVMIACDTAKGMAARLTGAENPSFADTETTFEELRARIAKTIEFMATFPDAAFEGAEGREVNMKAGKRELQFTGAAYLSSFATPNFYFHMTTVYAILRHNGVAVGKTDFLGAS